MNTELKIGAVFSLAPEEVSAASADEPWNEAADPGETDKYKEMTADTEEQNELTPDTDDYKEMAADDCEISVNNASVNTSEHDYVLTGADPEMNSSTEANDLEIDVVDGDINTDATFSADTNADPPVLPMEESVGILSSVYHDEMVEGLPPPVLSPMIDEKKPDLKKEPVEYEAKYMWMPKKEKPEYSAEDIKSQIQSETKKKCTKIYPCYIVLSDIFPLLGKAFSASYRFIRSLKKTECSNMCKKMYFRRRLKAGRNVFNVKTPSFIAKRMRYLEKIGEQCSIPKIKSDFTKLRYLDDEKPTTEGTCTIYPKMFMTKAGIEYSFETAVEDRKSRMVELQRKMIKMEKNKIKKQIKKEKEELIIQRESELKKIKEEENKEKERLDRELEQKRQHNILLEQIKIKREENFHKKAMRKKKQEMPYFKAGVSARSGRVIKPNSLFTDNEYALNGADIEGFRKLNALHERQRRVLAAMRQRENKAKRVNRVVERNTNSHGLKLQSLLHNVNGSKTEKSNPVSNADLEIDNPEKEDGVRKIDFTEPELRRPKKQKLLKSLNRQIFESLKKKVRKKRNGKGDGVLINTMPNTENIIKLLQTGNPHIPVSNTGHYMVTTDDKGMITTSYSYPNCRSLLNASRLDQKDGNSEALKDAMVIDAKKEPIKFCLGNRELRVQKVGDKLVFLSPTSLDNKTKPLTKTSVKSENGGPSTASSTGVDSKQFLTSSNVSVTSSAVTNVPKALNPVLWTNAKSMSPANIVKIPFPFVSVPSTVSSSLKVADNHFSLSNKPIVVHPTFTQQTMIVNPAVRSTYAAPPAKSTTVQSVVTSQEGISTSSQSISAMSGLASSLPGFVHAPSKSLAVTTCTGSPVSTVSLLSTSYQPQYSPLLQTQPSLLVPVSNTIVFPTPAMGSAPYPQMAAKTEASISPSTSCSISTSASKGITLPVSQTNKANSLETIPKQATVTSNKGRFYLLKVDGKHILIPVPGPNGETTPQTKAYLVNEIPKLVSNTNVSSISTVSSVTLLSKQTVTVSKPIISRPCSSFVPSNTSMPILSYKVVKSDAVSVTTDTHRSRAISSEISSVVISSSVNKEPANTTIADSLPSQRAAPVVVTLSNAFCSVPKPIAPATVTPLAVCPAAVAKLIPVTRHVFPNASAAIQSVCAKSSTTIEPAVSSRILANQQDSDSPTNEPAQDRNGVIDSDKESGRNQTEPVQSVKEEEKSRPFSEVITDREERLKKLKELLKQKNEAVEQLRQSRTNMTTSKDSAQV